MAVVQEAMRGSTDVRRWMRQHPTIGLIGGILLLVAVVWVLEGARADDSSAESSSVTLTGVTGGVTPRIGEVAPDFTLMSTDGTQTSLSDLRGRPVLVNFWASWCAPCRGEMPDINQLAADYREAGLVVLGVNLEEDREPVLRYAHTLGLGFTLLLDSHGQVATRYNVTGLPSSYFVDRSGRVVDRNIGPLTPRGLRSRLDQVLRQGEAH